MKTKHHYSFFPAIAMMLMAAATASCSKSYEGEVDADISAGAESSMSAYTTSNGGTAGPGSGSDGGTGGNTQAGIVTAGEWNDLNNWTFWATLMNESEFNQKSDYWLMYTDNRVAIEVTDSKGHSLAGIPVKLIRQNDDRQATVWESLTDNQGKADCWIGFFQRETIDSKQLVVEVNGQQMLGHPTVSGWDAEAQPVVNKYVCASPSSVSMQADIAFVVDATGSMSDEIDFLKSDLVDIIRKAEARRSGMTFRTAALFYRDEGDEYVTQHSDFTAQLDETAEYVGQQRADGGGDYPEALHTALEDMLQKLSWNTSAHTRLAFLVLDAPAHHEQAVISSLQESVRKCAQLGIRLIPVAASGVDKNTEFMLRFFAIATGGTYVFITDDSGVGNSHIKASVGKYEVEQLNNLMIRLIDQYTE